MSLPILALPLVGPAIDPAALAVATIWQEARGDTYEGKLAVAEVIRDRTLWKYNSNGSLVDTLFRPYQFSGWNTDDPNRLRALTLFSHQNVQTLPSFVECARAWEEALAAGTRTAKGAVLYHAISMKKYPAWTKRVVEVARIGGHVFYRDPAHKVAK